MDQFWNDTLGAFKDSPSNISLYPQDANGMAIAFSVVPPKGNYAKRVSDYLANNWTPIGPICPELPKNVSPFISSIEVEGPFQAGRPDRALELMRTLWGWYLGNPNGTESTVIEGYLLDGTFGYRGDRGYRNDPSYIARPWLEQRPYLCAHGVYSWVVSHQAWRGGMGVDTSHIYPSLDS